MSPTRSIEGTGESDARAGLGGDMADRDGVRQAVVAEVLELGEALFDSLIGAVGTSRRDDGAGDGIDPTVVDELHAAAGEFFGALRALLGVERDGGWRSPTG